MQPSRCPRRCQSRSLIREEGASGLLCHDTAPLNNNCPTRSLPVAAAWPRSRSTRGSFAIEPYLKGAIKTTTLISQVACEQRKRRVNTRATSMASLSSAGRLGYWWWLVLLWLCLLGGGVLLFLGGGGGGGGGGG